MKKQLLILSAFLISMTVFGQKDEVKAAEKALKANDFASALAQVNKAEGMLSGADQKTIAKIYYLKALATYKNGAKPIDLKAVSAAFGELIKYESETKVKYTPEIKDLSEKLKTKTIEQARNAYSKAVESKSDADYKAAAKKFYTVYALSPKDTLFLDNAAFLYSKAHDYANSNKYTQQLLDLGYTGITTEYIATGINGEDIAYPDKKSMDAQVKMKLATNPRAEVKESRRGVLYNIMVENFMAEENYDKALEIIAAGRKEFPNNYQLLISEANVNYKKGNNTKFKELLEEAVQLDPENTSLYLNIGVMYKNEDNIEEAIKNFEKVIELDPTNSNAYNNIGATILDKTKPIQEEMNKSLSDFDKYDKLLNQQKGVYKEALPYYEKAFELDNSNVSVVQILVGIYENLEMTDKLKDMKAVYETLK